MRRTEGGAIKAEGYLFRASRTEYSFLNLSPRTTLRPLRLHRYGGGSKLVLRRLEFRSLMPNKPVRRRPESRRLKLRLKPNKLVPNKLVLTTPGPRLVANKLVLRKPRPSRLASKLARLNHRRRS